MSRFEFPNNDGQEFADCANPHAADVNCAGPDLPREGSTCPARTHWAEGVARPNRSARRRRGAWYPQRLRGCEMDLTAGFYKIEWLE